jgi:hypothetical protein
MKGIKGLLKLLAIFPKMLNRLNRTFAKSKVGKLVKRQYQVAISKKELLDYCQRTVVPSERPRITTL